MAIYSIDVFFREFQSERKKQYRRVQSTQTQLLVHAYTSPTFSQEGRLRKSIQQEYSSLNSSLLSTCTTIKTRYEDYRYTPQWLKKNIFTNTQFFFAKLFFILLLKNAAMA